MAGARVLFLAAGLVAGAHPPRAAAADLPALPEAFLEPFDLARPTVDLTNIQSPPRGEDSPLPATIPLPPAAGPGAVTLAALVVGASIRAGRTRRRS